MKTSLQALSIAILLSTHALAYEYVSNNPINAIDPLGLKTYFAYNSTHVWLAVDTPAGNVARQDFYAQGWTGGTGNNVQDAINNMSVPGIAPITMGRTLDNVMGKEPWTVYEIATTPEQDLEIFRMMLQKMLNPPRYSDFRNNCGDEAVDTLSAAGPMSDFPSGIFPDQFGKSARKIFGPPIRQPKN